MADGSGAMESGASGAFDAAVLHAVLGWSNPDTGPENNRLYALDAGASPRWAKPHGRVAEQALREAGGHHEGDQYLVVRLGDRFLSAEVVEQAVLRVFAALATPLVPTRPRPVSPVADPGGASGTRVVLPVSHEERAAPTPGCGCQWCKPAACNLCAIRHRHPSTAHGCIAHALTNSADPGGESRG